MGEDVEIAEKKKYGCDLCNTIPKTSRGRWWTGGEKDVCREPLPLLYTCHRCSGKFCHQHRLPETHDCSGIVFSSFDAGEDLKYNPPSFYESKKLHEISSHQSPPLTSKEVQIPSPTIPTQAVSSFMTETIEVVETLKPPLSVASATFSEKNESWFSKLKKKLRF